MHLFPEAAKSFKALIESHPACLLNGVLVALAAGAEKLFSTVVFKCPCDHETAFYYGLGFLLAPFAAFLIIGFLSNTLTWRLCQGFHRRRYISRISVSDNLYHVSTILLRSLIVPSAWLLFTFIDGDYYACMKTLVKPCDPTTDEYVDNIRYSQIIGWRFLSCMIGIEVLAILGSRYFSKKTYFQLRFEEICRDAEEEKLTKMLGDFSQNMAQVNVERLFTAGILKKADWDLFAALEPVQTLKIPPNAVAPNAVPPAVAPAVVPNAVPPAIAPVPDAGVVFLSSNFEFQTDLSSIMKLANESYENAISEYIKATGSVDQQAQP